MMFVSANKFFYCSVVIIVKWQLYVSELIDSNSFQL